MVRFEQCFALFSYMPLFYSGLISLLGCDLQKKPARQAQTVPTFQNWLPFEHNLFEQKKRYESLLSYLSKNIAFNGATISVTP